ALPSGLTLAVRTTSPAEIGYLVGSSRDEEVSVVGQIRGKIYFTRHFLAHGGFTAFKVSTHGFPAGVLQMTLFDHQGVEQCERLAFVNKNSILKVLVSTDKERYLPREKVTLKIHATDVSGKTASGGKFSLAVADDKLLSFADDKSGNILSRMLLEP